MNQETYTISVQCRNCYWDIYLEVPKGTTKKAYLDAMRKKGECKICRHCGCVNHD